MPNIFEQVKDNLEVKEQNETTVDKATDTETVNYYIRIINKDSDILDIYQPRCESSKEAQIASTELNPNVSDKVPSAEIKLRLDSISGNDASGKPRTKVTQSRKGILAGIVSA